MSTAQLLVRAILVTDGRSPHLNAVFDALVAGRVSPDVLHVVLTHGAPYPHVPEQLRAHVTTSQALAAHEAIDEVIQAHPALPREYLWLLHDDTAPMPDTLAALSATARKRRRAGVVGAAQVRWHDPSRLVNLGTTVSRVGARRVNLVDEDDVDQGQYHQRDDVLAVSLAAALVRRDVWEELGGPDPAYGGLGDSLEFCRRVWGRGHDVVIVPTAKVRHSQESLYGRRQGLLHGRRSTYVARRTGEWYHSLTWAPVWALVPLVMWAFVAAPFRTVARVAQNAPSMAGGDLLVPWALLRRLRTLPSSRTAARRASAVPASRLRPLFAGLRTVAHHVRASEWGDYEGWRALNDPSDVVKAELAAVAARRRRVLAAVVAVAVAVSAVTHGAWLQALASGQMLAGRGLGVTDVGTQTLATRVWTGWSEHGLGAPALDSAWAALMLPLSVLPGGTRWWLGLLLAGGAVWATLGAWAAAGAATRTLGVRAVAALAYGLWPTHLQAMADGRVGPVIAHMLLPWVAFGVARAAGWQRAEIVGGGEAAGRVRSSPSAAMGGAFALVVVTIAAPVTMVPAVVTLAVLALVAGRWRWRIWAMTIPSLVVGAPALVAATATGLFSVDGWTVLVRDSGPAVATQPTPVWQTLVGVVDTDPAIGLADIPWWQLPGAALIAILVVLALVALAARPRTGGVLAGWVIAVVGACLAVMLPRMVVINADGAGQTEVNGWPGIGMSLVALGLLMATATASARTAGHTADPMAGHTADLAITHSAPAPTRQRSVMLISGALVAAVAVLAHASATAWPRDEDSSVWTADTDVLPLVATLEQESQTRQRVLSLASDGDSTVRFTVLSGDGTEMVTGRAHHNSGGLPRARAQDTSGFVTAQGSLAEAVAQLAGGQPQAVADIAAWGIGVIVVSPSSSGLNSSLEQIPSVALMGASDRGNSWRVQRASSDQPPSRAWLANADDSVAPLSWRDGRVLAGIDVDADGVLVVAVPADPHWHATLDGEALEPTPDPYGRVAFDVPAVDGTLRVFYRDPQHQWWLWVSALAVGWVIVGSLPVHARREMEAAP